MKKIFTSRFLFTFLFLSIASFGILKAQTQITDGSFTSTCISTGSITWTNSAGTVLIFAKATTAITTGTPTKNVSTFYTTASTDWSAPGTAYEFDNAAFLVYSGTTGGPVNLTNLLPGTNYKFLIYNTDNATTYSAGNTFNGSTPAASALGEVTAVGATAGNDQASVAWTYPASNCYDAVMIVASTTAISTTPSGTAYTGNLAFGSGTAFGSGFVVYKGSGTSPQVVTNLSGGTQYFFKIWVLKGTVWSPAGVSASVTLGPDAATSGSAIFCTDAGTVSWTNPTTVGTILVFAKATGAITVGTPTANISTTYTTANPIFGAGTVTYENDNLAYLVYKGTGSSVNISGLSPATTYNFLIYNASGTSYSAQLTLSGMTTTTPQDVTPGTATPANTQVAVSWTNPTAPNSCLNNVLVVAYPSTGSIGAPTGSTYSPNSAYGSGAAFGSGFVVFEGTGNNVNVTSLTNCTAYKFAIFTVENSVWSTGITMNATPVGGAPAVVTLSPVNTGINIANNTNLQILFNGAPSIATSGPSSADTKITITDISISASPVLVQTIDRTDPSTFNITGNMVTIAINSLTLGKKYEVVVGNNVFTVCGSAFGPIASGAWDFTVSAGVSITAPSTTVCPGSYTALGDIIIKETADNNFQLTSSPLTLSLKIVNSVFAFQSGAGPSVSITAGGDITTTPTITSNFSSSTLTISFTGTNLESNIDQITIHGLNVTSDGSNPATSDIVFDAPSSTLTIQGVSNGTVLASVTAGMPLATPTNAIYSPAANGGVFCQGTDLSPSGLNATISVTPSTSLKWFKDAGLANLQYSGPSPARIVADLGIDSNTPGTTIFYVIQSSGCQSGAYQVPVTINPLPGIDAGHFATNQCSGNVVTLGGSPTIITPTKSPYTYSWAELTTHYTGTLAATSNPVTDTLKNTTSANLNYQFQVTVTDGNGCSTVSTPNTFNVTPQEVPVLSSPNSTVFTTSTTAKILAVSGPFKTSSYTGIGVVQTNTSTYGFDPSEAWNKPAPLPQSYNVFFNGKDTLSGCPINNLKVATMILTNTTFLNLLTQYCSDEFPSPVPGDGIQLTITPSSLSTIHDNVVSWNNSGRLNRSAIPMWNSASAYNANDLVYYGSEVYRATIPIAINGVAPSIGPWVGGAMKIKFNGLVRDQNELQLGGFPGTATINGSGTTHLDGSDYYLNTKPNYLNCLNCAEEFPTPYAEFDVFSDVKYYFPQWVTTFFSFHWPGDIVYNAGNIYMCIQFNGNYPPYYSSALITDTNYWINVTGTKFESPAYQIWYDGTTNQAGIEQNGQFVTINQNPVVSFNGFSSTTVNSVCQSDITGTQNNTVPLNSSFPAVEANRGTFQISLDGGTTWLSDGPSFRSNGSSGNAVVNTTAINSGTATFNSLNAWNQVSAKYSVPAFAYSTTHPYSSGDNVNSGVNFYTATAKLGNLNKALNDTSYWHANALKVDVRLYYETGAPGSTHGGAPIGGVGDNCFSTSSVAVIIHQSPVINSLGTTPNTYCSYDPSVVQFTTNPSTGIAISGNGVTDGGSGMGSFVPKAAYALNAIRVPQTVPITATYTDSFGCQNSKIDNSYTVNPPPFVSYQVLKNSDHSVLLAVDETTQNTALAYCFNDPKVLFNKVAESPLPPGAAPSTYWTLQYDDGLHDSLTVNFAFDPQVYFNNATTNHQVQPNSSANFKIIYHSFDGASCKSVTDVLTITVSPVLDVAIQGISNTDVFCSNEGIKTLNLTNFNQSNSTLRINGVTQPIPNPPTYSYDLALHLGDVVFIYNVTSGTSGSSCQNPDTVTIKVLPSPIASFSVMPHCVGDLVQYMGTDASSNFLPAQYAWTFSDTSTTYSSLQNPSHKWNTQGNTFFVSLQLSYSLNSGKQCIANNLGASPLSINQTQIVGPIPTVDFSFSNVCSGDNTNFIVSTANGNGQGVTQYKWDFGDQSKTYLGLSTDNITASDSANIAIPNSTSGKYQAPIHFYSSLGVKNIVLYGRTDPSQGDCENSKQRQIAILPYIKSNLISPDLPYLMDATGGGWIKEDKDGFTTWNFGTASPSPVSLPNLTQPAWTNIPYNALDHSYVNSPCFDMTKFTQPAIGLQYFMNVRVEQDGGVLQYSTTVLNHIQKWKTLGSIGSGQNWYTNTGISGKPGDDNVGFNSNSFGWSDENDTLAWISSKHSLDEIPADSLSKVRFRIAFGSDGGTPLVRSNAGFAFNDVSIVERNRTVLIENFTNDNLSAITNDTAFYNFIPGGSSSMVKLEYHTSLPVPDSINLANSADPNARAAFYGLTNTTSAIPGGFLDGTSGGNFEPNGLSSRWLPNAYKLRSLTASPLKLSIDNSDTSKRVINVQGLQDIKTGNLRLFIAAVEEVVTIHSTASVAVTNKFVIRKIYPSASGMVLTTPFLKGTNFSTTVSPWAFPSEEIKDNTKIGTAAFIQDIDTKEVIQAIYIAPNAPVSVITGIDTFADAISTYPVPADKEFIIKLPKSADQDLKITLMNSIGQEVVNDKIATGQQSKTINTKNLADGVYILQLGNRGTVINRRVMVIHQ